MWNFFFGKKPQSPQVHTSFDMDKDMKYLFSLIATLLENERFKLDLHKKKILSDNDILEISNHVTSEVMQMIAPTYLDLLMKYIVDEDKVIQFVSLVVVKNTVQLGIQINKESV